MSAGIPVVAAEKESVPTVASGQSEMRSLDACINDLVSFALASIDYSREDRFFPAASEGLRRNPYCLANGLAGLAEALSSLPGSIPQSMRDCLGGLEIKRQEMPAGLFAGVAGISLALWNCGLHEEALRGANSLREYQDDFTDPFFDNGAAGIGTTALHLYLKSGDGKLLAFAQEIAERLLNSGVADEKGYWWPGPRRNYGLGSGSSGIALFLLYLYLAVEDERYLRVGEEALGFDLAAAKESDGGIGWEQMDANTGILYPYWSHGSAGVGEVVLRYSIITGKRSYRESLPKICRYVCRKYAVFPGLVSGLSGLGHFLLSCAVLLGDNHYSQQARVVAEGIKLHLIKRPGGLAVCGDSKGKLSCDYATDLPRFSQPFIAGVSRFRFEGEYISPSS